ncbi:MAG TPA: endonuclease domain-containing protein [Pseudolabrys sp.]|nr:endonuclease domain-containing protein [Pseudolabrys sp.]
MVANDKDNDRIWARADRTKTPPQRSFSRQMRKAPTEAERKLWWHLRHRLQLADTHFRRQVQVGPYIADFLSHKSKLIIEIDGGQHGSQLSKDQTRTRRLEADGYRVLRFWNNDVLSDIEGVLIEIHAATRTPTPDPSPQGGGERRPSPSRGG